MLRKILAAGAICAVTSGVSFGKTGALDILEKSFQEAQKSGLEYHCAGNDVEAACQFKDIDTFFFTIKDMQVSATLTDNHWKQAVSGKILVNIVDTGDDVAQFLPKSFQCENTAELKDLQNFGNGECVIKSDVATITLDSKTLVESRSYRYKTMPTLIVRYIAQIEKFSKEYDRIQKQYADDMERLQNKYYADLEDMQAEIDMIQNAQYIHKSSGCGVRPSNCGCGGDYDNDLAIQSAVAQKKSQKEQLKKSYNEAYDEISQQYDEDMAALTQDIVAWLKQYEVTLKEMRVYVRSHKLAESTFGVFAKEYLAANENIPLSKKEQQARAETKKRVTGQYYANLESMRAASLTFIGQSPYLADHLKVSLKKIVSDSAKLFDPNAHKRSMRILITPRELGSMNAGVEAQKLIDAYQQNNGRERAFMQIFFDLVNQYNIQSVRVWPQQ